MKLIDFVNASEYDVYICSVDQDPEKLKASTPSAGAYISNLLKGCAGIMDLSVVRFYIMPEICAIYAAVSLPWEIMQSIYEYNRLYNRE